MLEIASGRRLRRATSGLRRRPDQRRHRVNCRPIAGGTESCELLEMRPQRKIEPSTLPREDRAREGLAGAAQVDQHDEILDSAHEPGHPRRVARPENGSQRRNVGDRDVGDDEVGGRVGGCRDSEAR